MKISQRLPQFEKKAALLLVTGKQDAKLYLAKDGEITRIASFRLYKPKYSDREGFFMTRSTAGTIRSGSVYEDKEEVVIRDFMRELSERVKEFLKEHEAKEIYVFASPAVVSNVEALFPEQLKKKIRASFHGNYYKEHAFKLLEMIKEKIEEKKVPLIKPESKKILDKSRKARSASIKGK